MDKPKQEPLASDMEGYGHWSTAQLALKAMTKERDALLLQNRALEEDNQRRQFELAGKLVELDDANRLNRAWEKAVNVWCSCGGRSPNDAGVCVACRVYHTANGTGGSEPFTEMQQAEKRIDATPADLLAQQQKFCDHHFTAYQCVYCGKGQEL